MDPTIANPCVAASFALSSKQFAARSFRTIQAAIVSALRLPTPRTRLAMNWSPLGENALLVRCADECSAAGLAGAARGQNWPWLLDVVQAYASVAVYFDRAHGIAHDAILRHLRSLPGITPTVPSRAHH